MLTNSIFPIEFTEVILAYEADYYNYYYNTAGEIIDSMFVDYDTVLYNYSIEFNEPYEIINRHEIARVITPYGGNYTPSWEIDYTFDITDFSCLLHDSVEIRLFYSGWSDGFEATLKYEITEGPFSCNSGHIYIIYVSGKAISHIFHDISATPVQVISSE